MATSTPPAKPVNYLVLLFPCFQLLDLAGPLDILNLLTIIPSLGVPEISLTILASTLDPVPTKPIPPKSGAWTYDPKDLAAFSTSSGGVNTACNQYLVPDMTFDEYTKRVSVGDSTLKPIDVIFIPGGIGTRIGRLYPSNTDQTSRVSNIADLQEFLKFIHPRARYIMTVCTGSEALAQTNLLANRRATTNMTHFTRISQEIPTVKWQRARRFVRSLADNSDVDKDGRTQEEEEKSKFKGEIWTSAGISAGIDVMLNFVAEFYGGVDVARQAARTLEYSWSEMKEGDVDPMYDGWK